MCCCIHFMKNPDFWAKSRPNPDNFAQKSPDGGTEYPSSGACEKRALWPSCRLCGEWETAWLLYQAIPWILPPWLWSREPILALSSCVRRSHGQAAFGCLWLHRLLRSLMYTVGHMFCTLRLLQGRLHVVLNLDTLAHSFWNSVHLNMIYAVKLNWCLEHDYESGIDCVKLVYTLVYCLL